MRVDFVRSTLERLLREGVLQQSSSILAVCSSRAERNVFYEVGFTNVTISSIWPEHLDVSPFCWSRQDVQSLSADDRSFDFAFVSDGLHHCASPHRALTEMYRVSRHGVVVFESRDSVLVRAASRWGLTQRYELQAIRNNNGIGGYNNSAVPNYVYRWTEREFEKTLRTYDPTGELKFLYYYGLNLPFNALMAKGRAAYAAGRVLQPLAELVTRVAPRQCNSFCMVGLRPRAPWHWLVRSDDGSYQFNTAYMDAKYKGP